MQHNVFFEPCRNDLIYSGQYVIINKQSILISEGRQMKEIDREIKAKIAASYDAIYLYCRYNLYSSDKAPDVTQDIFCAFVEEYETMRRR